MRVELDEKLSLKFDPTDTLIELLTLEIRVPVVMILVDDFLPPIMLLFNGIVTVLIVGCL